MVCPLLSQTQGSNKVVNAIVVLGSQHHERLYRRVLLGVQLWQKQQDSFIVFTGYAAKSERPEAAIMAHWARTLGVTPEAIIIEDQAQNTIENAFYAREILQKKGVKSAVIITSDFHVPRSSLIFKTIFQDTDIEVKACGAESVYSEHEDPEKIRCNEADGTLYLQNLIMQKDFKIEWLKDRQRTHPKPLQR
eukprot:TRINITY_DN1117_c0_g1_i1.p2 TRINITY_DN1117_c0_g1~~TRINITY_DN1117_c0_g1_i1.p2  ORF type:complete len:192 (-),score=7.54 TRINITY_DN1117_c0_g1_i1:658-1233(-)